MITRKSGQVATARKQAHSTRCNENVMRQQLKDVTEERNILRMEMRQILAEAEQSRQRVAHELNSIRDGIAQRMNPAKELATVKATVKHLKAHPDKGIALMAKAGICTVDGRLKKAYGGNTDD